MLCDFNCSKYVPAWIKQPNDAIQTFHYRAPEIVLGLYQLLLKYFFEGMKANENIDIFSVGAMLAELASGYIVFDMDSKNIQTPNLIERAKHLRLMEREMGSCPTSIYEESPDEYFYSGEWLRSAPLAPCHSWFREWVIYSNSFIFFSVKKY